METPPPTVERFCSNEQCGIPLGIHAIQIEPGVFICQHCFRQKRKAIYQEFERVNPWRR